MYTAPPSGDEEDRDVRPNATEDETETDEATETDEETTERSTLTVESSSATTDANWTGTVPADD